MYANIIVDISHEQLDRTFQYRIPEALSQTVTEDIVQTAGTSWGREHFWDEVPLTLCKKHYRIALRVCGPKDILEIDTLEELAALDASYRPLLGQASPALR